MEEAEHRQCCWFLTVSWLPSHSRVGAPSHPGTRPTEPARWNAPAEPRAASILNQKHTIMPTPAKTAPLRLTFTGALWSFVEHKSCSSILGVRRVKLTHDSIVSIQRNKTPVSSGCKAGCKNPSRIHELICKLRPQV